MYRKQKQFFIFFMDFLYVEMTDFFQQINMRISMDYIGNLYEVNSKFVFIYLVQVFYVIFLI